jgi:hypothetical protein
VRKATNARAETQYSATIQTPHLRPWSPVHPTEVLYWLSVLFYMANHTERSREAYWQESEDERGTTRKNHKEFPRRFIDIKLSDSYGSCSTEVIDHCLCFLWQDNAPVIGISTAFSIREGPQDYIVKERKRPLNNAVAALIFGAQSTKELPIPKAIDHYNC